MFILKKNQKITVRWCEGLYLLYQYLGCMCLQWLGDYGSKCWFSSAVVCRLIGHFFFLIKFIKFLINFDFRITQNPCNISMKVLLLIFIFYFVHAWFAFLYVCAPLACMVPSETRKGHQITWHWSCCQWWAVMCVLGINHGLPGRIASSLNHPLSILSMTQSSWTWQWL